MQQKVDYNPFHFKEKPIRGYPGYVMLENRMVFDSRTGKQRMPYFLGTKMYVKIKGQVTVDVMALHTKLFGSKKKNYKGHFYRELKRFEELEIVEMARHGVDYAEIRNRFSIYNPKILQVLDKYKHDTFLTEQEILKKLAETQNENQKNKPNQGGESTGHHE